MDGRNVFIKNGTVAKKDWEIIKGVKEKKEEWPPFASEQRASSTRTIWNDWRETPATTSNKTLLQQQLRFWAVAAAAAATIGGVVCVCVCVANWIIKQIVRLLLSFRAQRQLAAL